MINISNKQDVANWHLPQVHLSVALEEWSESCVRHRQTEAASPDKQETGVSKQQQWGNGRNHMEHTEQKHS